MVSKINDHAHLNKRFWHLNNRLKNAELIPHLFLILESFLISLTSLKMNLGASSTLNQSPGYLFLNLKSCF